MVMMDRLDISLLPPSKAYTSSTCTSRTDKPWNRGLRVQAGMAGAAGPRYRCRRHAPEDDAVICGDFNVDTGAAGRSRSQEMGRQRAFPSRTSGGRFSSSWGSGSSISSGKNAAETHLYSWWGYRMGAFSKDRGLRIDLALVTQHLPHAASKQASTKARDSLIVLRPRALH